jgi:hypothetical protein
MSQHELKIRQNRATLLISAYFNITIARAEEMVPIHLTEDIIMKLAPFIVTFLIDTGLVYAQESAIDKEIDQRFALADKNKDGKLTLAEAKEGMPRIASNFS